MTDWGSTLAFWIGSLAYLGAVVIFFGQLWQRAGSAWGGGAWWLAIGAGGHLVYITLASLVARVCPVESVHFALSVAALVAAGAFLLGRLRWRIDALGIFVAPLGLAFLLGTRLVGLEAGGQRLPPVFLTLHVAANLVGLALFLLSCLTAGFYLFVEKRLKQKRFTPMARRLPPLDALDQAEHRFLLTGFPLLTLGIITGAAWSSRLEAGGSNELWRAALSFLTWFIFAAVLLLRAAGGWRGRRAALGTITGFFFALLVVVGYLVRPTPAPAPLGHAPHEVRS